MSPDGFPVYAQSGDVPGAFVVVVPQRRHARRRPCARARAAIRAGHLPARMHAVRRRGVSMFTRLPDDGATDVTIIVDGTPSTARAGRHGGGCAARCGLACIPHDGGVGRPARTVLHDGRVLRLPRHDRRRAQPPGVPRAWRRWHADRTSARADAARSYVLDVAIVGAGPAGLAAATVREARPVGRRSYDEQRGAGRADLSRHRPGARSPGRDILGDEYWPGASLVAAFRRSGARTCRTRPYGRSHACGEACSSWRSPRPRHARGSS